MTLDFLPPQAYTKETLLKAYHWLQDQSEQVREMAATPDQLVSLYLKATRHGAEALERPSLQSFKSELKNLAGMMGGLEKNQSSQPAAPTAPPQANTPPPQPTMPHQPTAPTSTGQSSAPSVPASNSRPIALDELTQSLIREVKNELNLSSDTESLRMLVKIGYQKVRSLYK